MAKFLMSHTPPTEKQHLFNLSQREVDVLINVLHDLVVSDGVIKLGNEAYTPTNKTHADLAEILSSLNRAGGSVDNDYLSNFHEVVL